MNLFDSRIIVLIDVLFPNGEQIRHNVVGFEETEITGDLLQSCIEFVLANENGQVQIFKTTDEHEFDCIRFLAEDFKTRTKLIASLYDSNKKSMLWKNDFARHCEAKQVIASSPAIKIFPQILGDAEMVEDHSKIEVVTLQHSDGTKAKTRLETPCTVTEFGLKLLDRLEAEESLWFKVVTYPLYEVQRPNRTFTQYWLVEDKSVEG